VIMTWQMASLLLLGGSTVLLFAGMPVAISFIAINLIGAFLFLGGDAGLHQVARNSVSAAVRCAAFVRTRRRAAARVPAAA